MVTTNKLELKKSGEPEKLTVLTTARIPGPMAQPATKGIDPNRMITTHDEFPVDLGVDNHAEVDVGEGIVSRKRAGGPKRK